MKNNGKIRGIGKINMEVGKMWKKIGLALVAAGLAVTLLVAAAIPVCEAGPDEKVIKVGNHALLTGAIATTGAPATCGFADYIESVNDQGGINGVKIKVMWEDTGMAPIARAIIAHKRFKAAGVVLEYSIVQGGMEVLAPRLKADEIPIVGAYVSAPMVTDPMWCFGLGTTQDYAEIAVRWFKAQWTEERPPRLGAFHYDHTPGWHALEGLKWAATEYGYEFVGYEVAPMLGAIDTTTEWLRLAGKDPDVIYITACGATHVTMAKDCARLEIQKRGITIFDGGQCIEDTQRVVGRAVDGWYYTRFAPSPMETDVPAVQAAHTAAKKYRGWGPEDVSSGYLMIGWLPGTIAVEALRIAIEKVGFENLTGSAVREALVSIKGFDNGLMPPVTVTNERPFIVPGLVVYQYREGEPQRISEWFEWINGWFPSWLKELRA